MFSGGGYSSEAVEFLLSLHLHARAALRGTRLYAVQHGDLFADAVLQVSPCTELAKRLVELIVMLRNGAAPWGNHLIPG